MSAWLFETTEIRQRYKDVSVLLLKHKQGKIHLSGEQLRSLKSRRSQYGLFLRMLGTSAKHSPLMIFYEDQRRVALAKYGNKKAVEPFVTSSAAEVRERRKALKRAKVAATKATVEKFKPSLSSSEVRRIIKAYR
jgi:hypothetical protein